MATSVARFELVTCPDCGTTATRLWFPAYEYEPGTRQFECKGGPTLDGGVSPHRFVLHSSRWIDDNRPPRLTVAA